ncbi:MAG: hypothetical protein LBP61_07610, partial [Desulfovibrio sp.]|nr:hypothetical protein [Desulfovibrio sp.]
ETPEDRYGSTEAGGGETTVSREGDPLWIHSRAPEDLPEDSPRLSSRRGGKKRGRGGKEDRQREVPEGLKRRRLPAFFLRLFTLGALLAAGYLFLTGRGCSPAGL